MIIHDVTVMTGPHGPWASPPAKPMIGRDGIAMKDANGKARYSPVIEFSTREIRTKWSDAVIAAMRIAHPDVFA